MTYNTPVKRVVACIDGTWYDPTGVATRREGNNSNIFRIYSSIRQGTWIQDQRPVKQVAYYEAGIGTEKQAVDGFNDSITAGRESCDAQVNRLLAFCCEQLNEGTDELWLFGFSRGAYVCRTVADIIHQLSTLPTWDEAEYLQKASLLPAFQNNRQRVPFASKLFPYIVSKAWAQKPTIHFLGLLDTLKVGRESTRGQPALVNSTRTLRHALALNETRNSFQPYMFGPLPAMSPNLTQRSIIEAWFIGSHADIGGGAREDGLSLYPLQWLLLESRTEGLILRPSSNQSLTEEPLGLVFPTAEVQEVGGTLEPLKAWTFQYTNGIRVDMIDLRSSHRHGNLQESRKKVLQRRRSPPKRAQAEDAASVRSAPNTVNTEGGRKSISSWRSKFSRLTKKSSSATLTVTPRRTTFEVDSLYSPAVEDELVEMGPRPHTVQINPGAVLLPMFTSPRQVFDTQGLVGFLDRSPNGSIIHPSVYFVTDIYDRLGLTDNLKVYLEKLTSFKQSAFLKNEVQGQYSMDPWRSNLADLGGEELTSCRVLVCGRAGVGKSTLINKVFGTMVTQESSNEHGVHDVDEGFEMDTLPGLIVHDSRGFQSGATEEVELLERFVKKRASAPLPEERLDAIWFCVDVPSTRVVHEADKRIFEILDKYARAVPVIIVRTMKDRFISEHYGAARMHFEDAGYSGEELDVRARAQAEEDFNRIKGEDITHLELKLGLEKDFAPFVYTSRRDTESIKELVKQTIMLVPDEQARANFVSAQTADVDVKINAAIEEGLRLLNYSNWSAIMGSFMLFTSVFTTPTISAFLVSRVIKSFGLSEATKVSDIERIAKNLLWKNMGSFVTQSFSQVVTLLGMGVGLTMGTVIGGIPALASLPFASVPPAARLITKCTCDLALVLSAAFTRKGKFVTKQDFEEATAQYRAPREGLGPNGPASVLELVHKEIDRLIPIYSVSSIYEPLSIVKMRTEIQRIISRHRFSLDEDFVPPMAEEEEFDAGVEDVQGLDQWMVGNNTQRSPDSVHSMVSRGSPVPSWAATVSVTDVNKPLPPPPRDLHRMVSVEAALYEAGQKAYNGLENQQQQQQQQQAKAYISEPAKTHLEPPKTNLRRQVPAPILAELPDTNTKTAWYGNAVELQGSPGLPQVGPWFPGMPAELP